MGDIYIYGVISEWQEDNISMYGEVNLKDVIKQIQANIDAESLTVHINSPGGDVNVGFAIHDALRATGKHIKTQIEGLCASIATVVAFAGDERVMWQNSEFFIHNPWGGVMGDAAELQKYADQLKQIENKLADFYANRAKLGRDEILSMMKEETSLTAEQAKELGFVDEVVTTIKAVALINNKMTKEEKEQLVESSLEKFWNKIKSSFERPKNMVELNDAAGNTLIFPDVEPGIEPQVGDKATVKDVDGNETPANGSYVMPDGMTFVFENGSLTEKVEAVDNEALKNEIEQLKADLAAKESELSASAAEVTALKAQSVTNQTKFEEEIKALKTEIYNKLEIDPGTGKSSSDTTPPQSRTIKVKY